ncbi:MAG: hypothetical protein KAQ98_01380 [Bacteriovoracaceae bacterium]|nr:hypothetical protein [Bacteriovoracaceae bacterium]
MKIFILISFVFLSLPVNSRLLDKIAAVIDENIITLSQLKRIQSNLYARKKISNVIYQKDKYTDVEIAKILVERFLIREKLSEIGYVINDEQVEMQIKETERNLGVNRDYLLDFLNSNNLTFDEYFELIRETLEFNIFNTRIIRPLISITEQEVRNRFYRENINNKTLSFKYTLVDFYINEKELGASLRKNLKMVLTRFQTDGILPHKYRNVKTNLIERISEDGLTSNMKNILKHTDEGSFTKLIKIGNQFHVFFIKKKDLVESELFNNAKERIQNVLFYEATTKIISLWYQREQNKHYVKFF